ncbi:MAG: MFS transporter, partial [Duodenibacillus sp.]|nr:MFS transporter [Duodenibacillus sp.]
IAATALLALCGPGMIAASALLVVVSNCGYSIGESLNSAFLPELARPEGVGKVSGWGWSLGYAGGLMTLGLCLWAVQAGVAAGKTQAEMAPATSLITAAVFAVLVIPMFAWCKERAAPAPGARPGLAGLAAGGLRQSVAGFASVAGFRDFLALVACGFLWQCGIATVITLSAVYASAVMGFTMMQTMALVLVVNVTAAAGAFAFGYAQDALGHKPALAVTLAVWIAAVALAALAADPWMFWLSANLAGLAMGSCQSGGRALVALLAPASRLAEFFGAWNMAMWRAAVAGPMTYGAVTWAAGNDHRLAIAVTGLFFVASLALLGRIDVARGRALALGAAAPEPM